MAMHDFHSAFAHFVNLGSSEIIASWCTIAWKIWQTRNDQLWRGSSLPLHLIAQSALAFLHEWLANQAPPSPPASPLSTRAVNVGNLMLNHKGWLCFIDGATFADDYRHGYGIIFQDAEGDFIGALSGYYDGILDTKIVEAIAVQTALRWARDNLPSDGLLFTDAQAVVNAISSPLEDFSSFGMIVQDCIDFSDLELTIRSIGLVG